MHTSHARPAAVVVGCGVVGLTTALRLLDDGWDVEVWGARPPEATTSAVAAAIWYPYLAAPADRVARWGRRTYEALVALVESGRGEEAGVRMLDGRVFGEAAPSEADAALLPAGSWRPAPAVAAAAELAWSLRVPAIDMSIHLVWLTRELAARGGRLVVRDVAALADAAAGDGVRAVVNCTGLGARALCGDTELFPVRGQVVRVRNPGLSTFLLDDRGGAPTYVVPRFHDVVLGGTAEQGAWDERPDAATTADILERCRALEPRLRDAEVLEVKVGLRPARRAVRLEADDAAAATLGRDGVYLIHNYGHGGSGVTLGWGCAEDVASLLAATRAAAADVAAPTSSPVPRTRV
jgi:D-amino-acid oxidase